MMMPIRRKKRRLPPHPLRHFKPEHIPIKPKRPLQVRHLQMHMPDAGGGVDGCVNHRLFLKKLLQRNIAMLCDITWLVANPVVSFSKSILPKRMNSMLHFFEKD